MHYFVGIRNETKEKKKKEKQIRKKNIVQIDKNDKSGINFIMKPNQ